MTTNMDVNSSVIRNTSDTSGVEPDTRAGGTITLDNRIVQ